MRESPTFSPLYRQIKTLMLDALQAGEWAPGQLVPGEQELALRFGVSQGTVRKAVDELAAEKLLMRKQGKGTFVSSHCDPRARFRFLRLMPREGGVRDPKSEPLECWRAKAGQEAARMLEIAPGDPVTVVRRLLRFSNVPVVVDEIYLPGAVYPGLTLEVLKNWPDSLYALFEARYGLRMVRARESVRAVAAERTAAELLEVKEQTPLLSVERVTYTYGDRPVEWRRGLYRTDEYAYMNDLN